jgi:acetoin utilization deacetylase AcuC-like enzyme
MPLYYCDHHEFPLPVGHKFPIRKYRALRESLSSEFALSPGPLAEESQVALAHDPEYVHAFLSGALDAAVMRRIGFPWSQGLVQRTLASVGGTLEAARGALTARWSGNLAGGTHHAFRNEGSGFCVFNDIAVAIQCLRKAGLIRRAAVLDLDVHQGDGTAQIFQDDADVLTVSVHGRNNFPFRKQRSRIDIDLPDQAGDTEFLSALDDILPRVAEFRPEILLYQSGVDGLKEDKLGRLSLTIDGLLERDRRVFEAITAPTVVTLGGGYADPIALTVEAHANTFRTARLVLGGPA